MALPLVALRSVEVKQFVSLNAPLTKREDAGGGVAGLQPHIESWETFKLHRNSDNTVSFESSQFKNVFLRLDGNGVAKGELIPAGGGIVNGQFGSYSYEKFKIHRKEGPQQKFAGIVGVESNQFPGRFLRCSPGKVNVQGVMKTNEEFELIFVV